jgi:phytoene/squalene synthetase
MNDTTFGAIAEQPRDAALRQTIRHRVETAGTSFYWAMRLLPRHRRNGMYAIYAFCREVDDIADGERPVEHKIAALNAWREEIDAVYAGHPRYLVARALSEPVSRYHLRRDDFVAVIDGMEMDAREAIQAPDLVMLDLYCARVARTPAGGDSICRAKFSIGTGYAEPTRRRFYAIQRCRQSAARSPQSPRSTSS